MQASLKIAWNLGHGISMSKVSTLDVHYNSDIFVCVVLLFVVGCQRNNTVQFPVMISLPKIHK